jgi:NAD(P)-dependent dehydrogenase (short-subunit alcohol dehydrogenase family)
MSKPFDATSTGDDVLEDLDLTGKHVLVTGVSAGIGVATVRALTRRGAHVVGAARNLDKARSATAGIGGTSADPGKLSLVQLDLGSLARVRECTDALLANGQTFDIIIANAGIMACPKSETADGFETQFGVNHLGHFVLVNRLVPLLRPGARIVSVASAGHRLADVDLDDPGFDSTSYTPFAAYGRSKTATIQFAVAFDRRHRDKGIRATAVHPGAAHTELSRYLTDDVIQQMVAAIEQTYPGGMAAFPWKDVSQASATSLWAGVAAAADAVGGRYCEDCHVAEYDDGDGLMFGVRSYALDPARAEALWAKSEEMVGEQFQ